MIGERETIEMMHHTETYPTLGPLRHRRRLRNPAGCEHVGDPPYCLLCWLLNHVLLWFVIMPLEAIEERQLDGADRGGR